MASIQRHGGGWRAQVRCGDLRDSQTFPSRREAKAWAAHWEDEAKARKRGTSGHGKTLAAALARYRDECLPDRKGQRWEAVRVAAFLRSGELPAATSLADLTAQHFAAWRDARLAHVSAATVLRELALLGSVFAACRKDWGWLQESPLRTLRRPKGSRPRERVIAWGEIRLMLRALGYAPRTALASKDSMIGLAFLLALRTGMRAGEIMGLCWADVHASWAHLEHTKNGGARDVPLPPKAQRLMSRAKGLDDDQVLPVGNATRDARFRLARQRAGLAGFTFHDARHTAATRIGRSVGQPGRLSFVEFCRVFGWRDPRHALIYVNTSAAELATRMA